MFDDPIARIPPDFRQHDGIVTAANALSWELQPEEEFELFKAITGGGEGLKIGVGDTGVDVNHPKLEGINLVGAENFTNSRQSYRDIQGHGTFVLQQIYRLLPKAEFWVAKVLGDDGSGASSWIHRGSVWMAEQGVTAINESLGASSAYSPMGSFLESWSGILYAATGNSGRNGVSYPAKWGISRGTVPVGSYRQDGQRSTFSTTGRETLVMGPGEKVVGAGPNGSTVTWSGTSMATPNVCGFAEGYRIGKIRAGQANITSEEVVERLIKPVVKDVEAPGQDSTTGLGNMSMRYVIDAIQKEDGGVL